MKLISLLIQNNHKSPENYGLSFFKTALNTIFEEKQEFIKSIAYGVRIGKFADDIEEVFSDELLNL